LVLWTTSEFDDFAGKNGERLEVSGFSVQDEWSFQRSGFIFLFFFPDT
jgi:hypothetical protein